MAHRPGLAAPEAASAGDPQAPPGATPCAKSSTHCCHTKTSLTPRPWGLAASPLGSPL